jgi:hypothetical protein
MKASFLRMLKSHKVPLVTKVIGLLSFIVLCLVCLVSPFAALIGNNANTVVFVKDYGNINQVVAMRNGQLSMKLQTNRILYGINHRLVSSTTNNSTATSTDTPDACATLDALTNDDSPDSLGGSPNPLLGSPGPFDDTPDDTSDDNLDNATCLSLLSAADSDGSPDALDNCSYNLDLSGSPDAINVISSMIAQDLSGSPDAQDSSGSPDAQDLSGSPDALGLICPNGTKTNTTSTNQTIRARKMSLARVQMRPGEIIAVQSGKDVVIAISLGHNQVLMPNGTTMNLQ